MHRLLVEGATFLVPDDEHGAAAEPAEPADDRGVVGAQAVALELLKAVDQVADVVAGPRALLVARHLDRDPRVMATALVLQLPQAALQPLDLLGQVHAGH